MLSAMDGSKSTLERAFELAKSGECKGLDELRKKLKAEGYSESQIMGNSLIGHLRTKMREATNAHRT